MASADDLGNVPLFDGLSGDELEQLATWFEVKTVSEGVKLASEGAAGYSFYVLVAGTAVVAVDDEAVATYGPGDFFGEMAILAGTRRNATVTTTSPATVLVMFGTEFRQLEESQPGIAARLEAAVRQRQEELQQLKSGSTEST